MMKRFKARQTVRLFIFLLSGFVIAGCGDGGNTGHWLPGTTGATGATGAAGDTTRPTATPISPANAATGAFTNTRITATFSEAMAPATISTATFTVRATGPPLGPILGGTVAYLNNIATFTPTANLADNTSYTATITTGATDLAGNALAANFIWTFTTGAGGAALDNTAPTVTLTNPADNATGVATNSAVNATFSEAMNPSTISTATFTVRATGPPLGPVLAGTVAYLGNIATFTPTANLADNTSYTATITTGATDLAVPGKALDNGVVPNPWTFTTGSGPVVPLAAINLRSAASFGVASRAGLTSTGVTVVNGNVALHPTPTCTDSTGAAGASRTCLVKTYSSPTGMTVNGSIFWAGDPFDSGGTALTVTNDLNIAWVEGKAKVPTQPTVAGDQLSSPTPYLPGVYHNATLGLAAGGLATLDAQGDANAIFIFQVDSSFVDSGTLLLPSEIRLIRGANARNVWFVAGLDVTIGSGTKWNGTILAGRTIVINNGSTVIGRALAGATGAGAFTLTGAAAPSVTTVTVPQ